MIVDLTKQVCLKAEKLNNLRRGASQNQSIQETSRYLEKFKTRSKSVLVAIDLCNDRILTRDRSGVKETLMSTRTILLQSSTAFLSLPNQLATLKKADDIVQGDLNSKIKRIWADSIVIVVNPLIEALRINLRFLPETDQAMIKAIKAEIDQRLNRLPNKTEDITTLMGYINQLKQLAEKYRGGLEPEISKFLKKVQSDEATIEDLNDEILKWIKSSGNMNKFNITLYRNTQNR